MATAREAHQRATQEFDDALLAETRRFLEGLTAKQRDQVGASALTHAVTKDELGGFHAAVAYGLREESASSIAPSLPCPTGLINGHQAEEDAYTEELREVAGENSRLFSRLSPSRGCSSGGSRRSRRAHDPSHPARLKHALADLTGDLTELRARYGIATGMAIRFLADARQQGVAPRGWFQPVTAEAALAKADDRKFGARQPGPARGQ